MKYVTIVFMMFYVPVSFSQWQQLNNLPAPNSYNSVFFFNDDHGWIAGSGGVILKFHPEYFTWEKITSGTAHDLNTIGFFDDLNGICAGDNGTLLISSNGGSSWTSLPLGRTNDLEEIQIFNNQTAYISGEEGLILKSTDKGLTWSQINIPTSRTLYSIYFISSQKGFAGTDSCSIYRTTNGGTSWSKTSWDFSFDPDLITSLQFIDEMNGYAGGGNFSPGRGFLRKTTDGGISWSENESEWMVRGFHFTDMQNGVITGGEESWNRFIDVKNNGTTIHMIFHNEDYDVMDCFVTPAGRGWAVGDAGAVFYADNYKQRWAQVFLGSADSPEGLSSSAEGILYLGSERNNFRNPSLAVMRGYQQNRFWKDVSKYDELSGDDGDIIDLCMVDTSFGYYISGFTFSAYGIQKTTNGGFTWTTYPTPEDYGRIFFINRNTGWYYNNNIYKTTDGGLNWQIQYSAPFQISELKFTDENTGYACGSDELLNGKIIKSANGGSTWSLLNIPQSSHLTTVAFSSPNTGITAGWGGTLLRTTDGGISWTNFSSPTEFSLVEELRPDSLLQVNDKRNKYTHLSGRNFKETKVTSGINYTDAVFKNNIVLAGSDSGFVLVSTNSGETWISQNIGHPVLEVEHNGISDALARVPGNVYLNKLLRTTPVELMEFSASLIEGSVLLKWITISETNNFGFEIEKLINEKWQKIGFVEGKGTTVEKTSYFFTDNQIISSGQIRYRLKQIDFSGDFTYSGEINLVSSPENYTLEQNYPNPFNPVTTIRYNIPSPVHVQLTLSDILGREIIKLEDSPKESGTYELLLNAFDLNLTSGVYFYTLKTASFSASKKMIIIK